jgi:hypothetical protein
MTLVRVVNDANTAAGAMTARSSQNWKPPVQLTNTNFTAMLHSDTKMQKGKPSCLSLADDRL